MSKKGQVTEIKIEKGFPIPASRRTYPFDDLKVGESFFVKDVAIAKISGSRGKAEQRTGFKFVARTMDGGVRVWRIQ